MVDGVTTPTCSMLTLANPLGRHQGNLPRLLRRVASEIAALGNVMILDVVVAQDITADGPWFEATVYYDAKGWSDHR
jgi:hypothetical protein